jgi:hypothetical protein
MEGLIERLCGGRIVPACNSDSISGAGRGETFGSDGRVREVSV